jgi:acetate kinase
MKGAISVINSGSSSIKFSLFDQDEPKLLRLICRGQVDGIGGKPVFRVSNAGGEHIEEKRWQADDGPVHEQLLDFLVAWIGKFRHSLGLALLGVGHRVVHGGSIYSKPVIVDDPTLAALERFSPLAPLHQPHNLETIRTIQKLSPATPQVACFDTAFHATIPPVAQRYGLPHQLSEEGVRRYGFHGLSYEYVSKRLAKIAPEVARGRVIIAHLGSGASMCALKDGRSVASTMGFSAMDGLIMGTRPGNLDPGVLFYLIEEKGYSLDELSDLLYRRSGLLGMSAISNDMRVLLRSEKQQAKEAIATFVYRLQRELGSLTAALGGLDALVFTAGIGENSPEIRELSAESASWLGVDLDRSANLRGDTRISTTGSRVSVWVIPTNEELMIAMHTRDVLISRSSSSVSKEKEKSGIPPLQPR